MMQALIHPYLSQTALPHQLNINAEALLSTDSVDLRFAGMSGSGGSPISENTKPFWESFWPFPERPRKLTAFENGFFDLLKEESGKPNPDINKIKGMLAAKPKGFSFNVRDKKEGNRTFLQKLISHSGGGTDNLPLIEFLLEDMNAQGINAKDKYGNTALHKATAIGSQPITELLLKKMSRRAISAKNETGNTALHNLYALGNMKNNKAKEALVNLLLSNMDESTINAQNEAGETILHKAVIGKDELTVQLLLEKMSDKVINKKNFNKQTALDTIINSEDLAVIAVASLIIEKLYANELSVLGSSGKQAFIEGMRVTLKLKARSKL